MSWTVWVPGATPRLVAVCPTRQEVADASAPYRVVLVQPAPDDAPRHTGRCAEDRR